MNKFVCDYDCRTVGEGITKYNIPDDWSAEFDIYDDDYPIICIPVAQIREKPAVMRLPLRNISDEDKEYASCILFPKQYAISFKIDCLNNLLKALE